VKHINFIASGTIQYNAIVHNRHDDAEQKFLQVLKDSKFSPSDFVGKKIIIDFRGEGSGEIEAAPLVNIIKKLSTQDLMVLFNASVEVENLPYHAVCMPTWMTTHCNWLSYIESVPYCDTIDRKFLCLMRRPNDARAKTAKSLLELGNSVRMSFGSQGADYTNSLYRDWFPEITLPITIDGIVERTDGEILLHNHVSSVFHSCLFNIVAETGSQSDTFYTQTIFITEKSFKAFALRQIPIWVAMPGLAAEVRKLGFDMFDDIIDHSYDSIPDEDSRIHAVMQQVKKLNHDMTLDQCQSMRRDLQDRLQKNFELVQYHRDQAHPLHIKIVHDFENRIR